MQRIARRSCSQASSAAGRPAIFRARRICADGIRSGAVPRIVMGDTGLEPVTPSLSNEKCQIQNQPQDVIPSGAYSKSRLLQSVAYSDQQLRTFTVNRWIPPYTSVDNLASPRGCVQRSMVEQIRPGGAGPQGPEGESLTLPATFNSVYFVQLRSISSTVPLSDFRRVQAARKPIGKSLGAPTRRPSSQK